MTEQNGKPEFPVLIDSKAFALVLGVGERFVQHLVAERRIEIVKVGRYVRFDPDTVRKWIEEHKRPPREEPRR